jgi:hypothetical protein
METNHSISYSRGKRRGLGLCVLRRNFKIAIASPRLLKKRPGKKRRRKEEK